MIHRQTLECLTCGHKTITRSAVGHSDYQEFAFPCGGCGLEIRFGMDLPLNASMGRVMADGAKKGDAWFKKEVKRLMGKPGIVYAGLKNTKLCLEPDKRTDTRTFDCETLNPVKEHEHFTPFMATVSLPKERLLFERHQYARTTAANICAPQIQKLAVHFERKQWTLFDKQLAELQINVTAKDETERMAALFKAAELNGQFAYALGNACPARIRQRIALAESTSPTLVKELVEFFQSKRKDEAIIQQLWAIRAGWAKLYNFLFPIYISFYWDDTANSLDHFTLAQKRFDELKPFYQECFETFCRISVIAASLEGIILNGSTSVPSAKGGIPLGRFDTMTNGSKPTLLKSLVIGDIFVPFIDSKLRNGIGHHAAHYDVKLDSIHYVNENEKGATHFQISYVRFCEKVVRLYGQLEIVSIYAHWLKKAAF